MYSSGSLHMKETQWHKYPNTKGILRISSKGASSESSEYLSFIQLAHGVLAGTSNSTLIHLGPQHRHIIVVRSNNDGHPALEPKVAMKIGRSPEKFRIRLRTQLMSAHWFHKPVCRVSPSDLPTAMHLNRLQELETVHKPLDKHLWCDSSLRVSIFLMISSFFPEQILLVIVYCGTYGAGALSIDSTCVAWWGPLTIQRRRIQAQEERYQTLAQLQHIKA